MNGKTSTRMTGARLLYIQYNNERNFIVIYHDVAVHEDRCKEAIA